MKDTSILESNGINLRKSLELFGDMATYDQMLEDFLKEVDNKLAKSKKYKEDGTYNENEVYEVSVSDVQELDEDAKVMMQIETDNS